MRLHGRNGLVLGAAIVVSAGLAVVAAHLRLSRISPARVRSVALDEAIERERLAAARRPAVEEESARLEARAAEFRALLPEDGADLESLRRSVTDAASSAGVLVTAVRPSPAPQASASVEEITVLLEARGTFASLGRFLDAVESLPRALTVDQFELKPAGAEGDAPRTTGAELAVKLTVWRVREGAR